MTKSEVVALVEVGESFQGKDLSNLNLQGADLSGAEFACVNLTGANLENANLSGANLNGAILRKANLRGACLRQAYIVGADLREANFENAILDEAFLSGAHLQATCFRRASLKNTMIGCPEFELSDLFGELVDFTDADLENAVFGEVTLRGVNLLRANLKHTYLYEADLLETVVEKEQLEQAITKQAVQ